MPRPKGTPNKLTSEIKERLQSVIESTMESIRIDDMNTNQKLKLLQLGLQYIMPKLRSINDMTQEQDEDLPFLIDIHKRDPETEEWVHEYIESSLPKSLMKNNKDKWS